MTLMQFLCVLTNGSIMITMITSTYVLVNFLFLLINFVIEQFYIYRIAKTVCRVPVNPALHFPYQ